MSQAAAKLILCLTEKDLLEIPSDREIRNAFASLQV